jgi:hypothetical protein
MVISSCRAVAQIILASIIHSPTFEDDFFQKTNIMNVKDFGKEEVE